MKTTSVQPLGALQSCLKDHQHPIRFDVIETQIRIAVNESTDLEFLPPPFRISTQVQVGQRHLAEDSGSALLTRSLGN